MLGEINEIGQYIPLHYHFQMLSDTARMSAFRSAIEKIVTSKHRVADLGSGTGALSFFSAKQGAKVWGIEFNPSLVSASRKFIEENGVSHLVQISQGDAASWLPPEPVDVVTCEMLHSALLREKQFYVVSSFRDAHFKHFGTKPLILPNATLLAVQPVWQNYNFEGFRANIPLFQSPYDPIKDCVECCDPSVYKIIDYDNAKVEPLGGDILFQMSKDSKVNALRFITKNLLTMDFYSGKTIDWHSQNLIIPLQNPLDIISGQTLRATFNYNPGDPIEALHKSITTKVQSPGSNCLDSSLDYHITHAEDVPIIDLQSRGNSKNNKI